MSNHIDIPNNSIFNINDNNITTYSSSCPSSFLRTSYYIPCIEHRLYFSSLSNSLNTNKYNISDSSVISHDKSVQTTLSYINDTKIPMSDKELDDFLFELDNDFKVVDDSKNNYKKTLSPISKKEEFDYENFDGHIDSLPDQVFYDIANYLMKDSQ
jgi:hypothetical protein